MHVPQVSRLLRDRGHRVTVVARAGSRIARACGEAEIPVQAWGGVRHLRRVLAGRGADLVHAHLSHDLWRLVPALVGRPEPLVLTRCMLTDVNKRDAFHRWLHRRVAVWIAVAEAVRENLMARCAVPAERILVVPWGIDLERFRPEADEVAAFRRELGIPKGAPLVGLIGRIDPKKGQEEFLRAADRIAGRHPEAHFLFAGRVPPGQEAYAERIRSLAVGLAWADRVHLLGHREDVPRLLGAVDVLVLSTYEETSAFVVLEAMAAGRAVVATDSGGTPEAVRDGQEGLLVPPRDVEALAGALDRLLADPALRRRLGEAARRRAETMYGEERMVEEIESVYREILKK